MIYGHAIRQIIRTYKKHYILATAITVILAIGMGVNIAVFMIINAALFRPLPVAESQNLLSLYDYDIKNRRFHQVSYPDYLDLAEYSSSFDGFTAYMTQPFRLKVKNQRAQLAIGEVVSDNYLDVLGIKPVIGHTFTDNMGNNGNYSPVIISYYLWKSRFNSDPDIVGAELKVNEKPFTVIGVMPAKFLGNFFPGISIQLWIPFSSIRDIREIALDDRGKPSVIIIGRLRNNVTLSQAQAEMDSRGQQLEKMYPSSGERSRNYRLFPTNDIRITPDPSVVSIMRGVSLLLQALVATILLVVVLNIAALFLAWGLSRKNEIAIIMALGCTRGRIICQLLAENVVTSLIGGMLGLLIASFLPGIISNLIPALPMDIEIIIDAPVDTRVVAFMFFLCIGTGVMAGLIPAIRATNVEPAVLLAESDRQTSSKLKINRLHWIIIPQIGFSMFLLIPAGLLCSSFLKISNAYKTPYVEQSAVVAVDFNLSEYSPEKKDRFLYDLKWKVNDLQGINSICLTDNFPLSGGSSGYSIEVYADEEKRRGWVSRLHVSNGCFETFGASLLQGRTFDEREDFPNSDVVIITESLAKKYWKASNSLNQHIIIQENWETWKTLTVIGVVKDVQAGRLDSRSPECIFLPFSQNNSQEIKIVGRGGSSAPLILDKLRQAIYGLDDNVIITEHSTMKQYVDRQLYMIKALIAVFVISGFSGLLLTCICIYGLISYSITQRRHEIGIRMAVGAQRKDIIMMFLKEGLKVIIPGILFGNIGAAFIINIASKSSAMGFIYNFIPRISLWNPLIFIGASAIIGLGTMLACYIPSMKMTFENPMTAIKQL